MLPVLALVGRPNVGKSTLFNRLTRSRDALVDNQPGVTRDRLYGRGTVGNKPYLVVDTGGIESGPGTLSGLIRQQIDYVIEEAQGLLFVVDAQAGLTPQDREIALRLRQSGRETFVVVNKSEGIASSLAAAEFQALAMGRPIVISALRGDGISYLMDQCLAQHPVVVPKETKEIPTVALVGRPNVGKSTLTNMLVGANRVIVSDQPGTTRDSIKIAHTVGDQPYVLIDTAGVRRRARVDQLIEKFSVVKTLQAIEESNVVILTLDGASEIVSQDATIAAMIRNFGRSMLVVVNKWDRLERQQRSKIKRELSQKLGFLSNAEVLFVSALHGSNVAEIMPSVWRTYQSAMISIPTSSLNRHLEEAVYQTPPPMHHRRPIRLKFAHQAGKNPPIIVVHGTQAESLPESYRKYLARYFTSAYRLVGTPVRLIPRSSRNPFKERQAKHKMGKPRSRRRQKR